MLIDADWHWLMLIDAVGVFNLQTFSLLIGSNKLSCRDSPISATAVAAASFKKRSPTSPKPVKGSKEERDEGKGSSPVAGKSNPSPGKKLFDKKVKLHCAPDSPTNLTAQRTLFRQYFLSCYDFGSFQSIWFCSEDFSDLVEEDAGGLLDRPSSQPTRWWAYSISLLSPSYHHC